MVIGARAYLYFGAPSLAVKAEQGSLQPALLTAVIVAVFSAWGAYPLSGAGVIRPLPLLRSVLAVIAAIYVLRGLILVPDLIRLAMHAGYPFRQTVFSATALVIGLAHIFGFRAVQQARFSHAS